MERMGERWQERRGPGSEEIEVSGEVSEDSESREEVSSSEEEVGAVRVLPSGGGERAREGEDADGEQLARATKRQKKIAGGDAGEAGDGQGARANSKTDPDGKKKRANGLLQSGWASLFGAAQARAAFVEDQEVAAAALAQCRVDRAPMPVKPAGSVASLVRDGQSEFFTTGEPYKALLTIALDQTCTQWISGKGAALKSLTKAKLTSAHHLCLCMLCAGSLNTMTLDEVKVAHATMQSLLERGETAARYLVNADVQALCLQPESVPSEQIKEAYNTLLEARTGLTTVYKRVLGVTNAKQLDEHLDSMRDGARPTQKAASVTATAASTAAKATAAEGEDNETRFNDSWSTFRKLSHAERHYVTSLYTTYVASTTLPLSAAESPALRELVFQVAKFFATREMTSSQPTPRPEEWYPGPCRQTVASNIVAVNEHIVNNGLNAFKDLLDALKRKGELADVLRNVAAIVGDLWRSPSGADMLAVQLCFLTEDWSFVKHLVLFQEVAVRKTGEQLAQVVQDYFYRVWKHGRLLDHVSTAVLDGASNNITMCDKLRVKMSKCMAHTLNNASRKAVAAVVANRMGKQMTILDALAQAQAALSPQVPGGDANDGDNGDELAALYRAAADEADADAGAVEGAMEGAVEGAAGAVEGAAGVATGARPPRLGRLLQILYNIGALATRSSAFNKALNAALAENGSRIVSLPARNATRWTSEYRLLSHCLQVWPALSMVVVDAGPKQSQSQSRFGYTFTCRSSSAAGTDGAAIGPGIEAFEHGDQELLEHVLAVMGPVNVVMTQLQAEFMPCGWAWLTLRMLYLALDDTRVVDLPEGKHMRISELHPEARQLAMEYRKQLCALFHINEMPNEEVLLSLGLDYQCRQALRLHGTQVFGNARAVGSSIDALWKQLQRKRGAGSSAAEKASAPLHYLAMAPEMIVLVAGKDIRQAIIDVLRVAFDAAVAAAADAAAAAVEDQGNPAGAEVEQGGATAATQAQTPRKTHEPGQLFADLFAFDDEAAEPEDDNAVPENDKTFWTYILTRPAEAPSKGAALVYKSHKDESGSLAWWRRNETEHAILASIARKSFAAPSTSVMPEALFSRVKYLESDQEKGRQRAELLAARAMYREGIENETSRLSALTIALLGERYRAQPKKARDATA